MHRLLSIIAVFAACIAFGLPLRAQEAPSPVQQPNTEPQPVPQTEQRREPQADQRQAPQAERREKPADFDNPRFAFHSVDDGYVRLDLQTGGVAMCRPRAFGWACTLAADERHAVDAEVARLQRENARLKQALLERGITLPTGSETAAPEQAAAPPAASRPSPAAAPTTAPPIEAPRSASPTPSDADIDRAMNVMEKFWRRLVAMMATMQRDMQK